MSAISEEDMEYLWGKFKRNEVEGTRIRNERKKFKGIAFNPSTGLDNESIKSGVLALVEKLKGEPHQIIKGACF